MSLPTIGLQNQLADRARIVGFELQGVEIRDRADELAAAITETMDNLRNQYPDPPSAAEWMSPARRLYRALGIDPSRRRPSSEALLRRVLQGKGLYTVNTAVDAANLASLQIALPVGLYDRDRIEAPNREVTLRLGSAGEVYDGIRKDEIHVEGRPVLADEQGAFGNPSADSVRTQVRVGTRALLFVAYAPVETDETTLGSLGRTARETMLRFVGGTGPDPWFG